MEGKYLITCDAWFYAPDGVKYRAVWGEVEILEDSFLGVKTNNHSSNWYAYVGNDKRGMVVAGCQIHYAVKCDKPPNSGRVIEVQYDASNIVENERASEIYLAE